MKTFLSSIAAYPWTSDHGFFFRGYFILNEKSLRGHNAISYLRGQLEQHEAKEVLRSLNGVFSIIWEREKETLFAVDRLRGLPLFYSVVDSELWVGDDAASLAAQLPCKKLSALAEEEICSNVTFVSGPYTLLEELFQVQASEYCIFHMETAQVDLIPYYKTEHGDFYDDNDTETLRTAFHQAYTKTGDSLVKALNGRTAVIPLSGGADSRMILSMLKEHHYEKVLCYTYGQPGNPESEISHMVAKEFGYPWTMVPYTRNAWEKLRNDPQTAAYRKFASSYSSTPHFQDYLAVKYLKDHGEIPADGVFVPGHSGDIPNGNHIEPLYMHPTVSQAECIQSILSTFYFHTDMSPVLRKRILETHPIPAQASVQDYATCEEWFDTAERQAKYIVNSVRVYEFFGHEWLIPLWDNNQFDFWKRVSLSWRYRRRLYYYLVNEHLPSTNDVTAAGRIADRIRKAPSLRKIAQRLQRFLNYWTSPALMERLYPTHEYLRMWRAEPAGINLINALATRYLLESVKQELYTHEE